MFVDDGQGWTDYAAERERHERRHEAADEPDDWSDGEPWTADTWHCPKCGSAASWESMADKLHCLTCKPPRRSQRIARQAAAIRRRRRPPIRDAALADAFAPPGEEDSDIARRWFGE